MFAACMTTPLGLIGIKVSDTALLELEFLTGAEQAPRHRIAAQVVAELGRYFDDPTWRFTVPLAPSGTAYQQRVWAMMRQIEPGATQTYGQLAQRLASSARAVGGACRTNPIAILIPCHRVVAVSGLGGFAGARAGALLAIKRGLLNHEGMPS